MIIKQLHLKWMDTNRGTVTTFWTYLFSKFVLPWLFPQMKPQMGVQWVSPDSSHLCLIMEDHHHLEKTRKVWKNISELTRCFDRYCLFVQLIFPTYLYFCEVPHCAKWTPTEDGSSSSVHLRWLQGWLIIVRTLWMKLTSYQSIRMSKKQWQDLVLTLSACICTLSDSQELGGQNRLLESLV